MLDHIINSIKLTFFTAVPGTTDLSGSAKENIKNSFYPAITGFRQTVNSYLHQSIFGLQATYEFDVNLSLIRTHCYPDDHNIGTLALEYVEGFVHELGKYTDVGRDEKKRNAFNRAIFRRKIRIIADDHLIREPGCRVNDGVFEINYHPDHYGQSTGAACQGLTEAIDKALLTIDRFTTPLLAKKSVDNEWDGKKRTLTKHFKEELGDDKLKLVVDADAIWKVVVASKNVPAGDIPPIAERFGSDIFNCFEYALFQIRAHIKKNPATLKAFRSSLKHSEIRLDVVPDGSLLGKFHECKIDDGVLVLRTSPSYFENPGWLLTDIESVFSK